MRWLLLLSMVLAGNTSAQNNAPECATKLRAVIDMGSGTTKLNLGEVEICKKTLKLVRFIEQESTRAVPLEASKNPRGEIPIEAQERALTALRELRAEAGQWARKNGFDEFEVAVVGTHALRTARNRAAIMKQIEAAGFSIKALSHDEEARAGFAAVAGSPLPLGCAKDSLLVWDVGGGSTQFVRAQKGKPALVKFDLGAENFRKKIRSTFKPPEVADCPVNSGSPNPLGRDGFEKARRLVRQEARLNLKKLQSQKACVVGIGGVHTKAVAAQIQKNWPALKACACPTTGPCQSRENGYSKKELECLGKEFADKSDCAAEIKGPYAATSVSNLALILGFIDQLGVEQIHTAKVNIGHHFVAGDPDLKFKKSAAAPQ